MECKTWQQLRRTEREVVLEGSVFLRNMCKEDEWMLIENLDSSPVIPIKELEIVSIIDWGERISGKIFRERAIKEGALGQREAEFIWGYRDRCIPGETLRTYLVFPTTVWRTKEGRLAVPNIGRDSGKLGRKRIMSFSFLDLNFTTGINYITNVAVDACIVRKRRG